ncbi:hypothetical protein CNY89_25735, partial [Amaricoccus sp. HAR-UPW-R2A-40]
QIHISALSADTLRPGQLIDVADAAEARRLLNMHPTALQPAGGAKALPAPANKADNRRKTKSA